MFKAPSITKPINLAETHVRAFGKAADTLPQILDGFLLAARLKHLIAIGGSKARRFLFSEKCTLTAQQIAKFCRRMPQFIAAKLEELYAGGKTDQRNSARTFDVNEWATKTSAHNVLNSFQVWH